MTSDRRIRQCLAALAIVSLAGAVYASAIPLRFHEASLTEVWGRFLQTSWFWLGLDKRADWVANGLVLIPFGFFFAGALQWPQSTFRRKQIVLIGFALLHLVIVSAIEAMQVWFPPRVRSLNDMLAGYVGGLTGVLLWNLVGHRIMQTAIGFPTLPKGFPRMALTAKVAAMALLLYGLMPFDVMLTPPEWAEKAAKGRFNLLPFADLQGIEDAITKIVLSAWAFALGVVLASQNGKQHATREIVSWCLAVELISLPIYGRETSITMIAISVAWGILGVRIQDQVFRLLNYLDRPRVWFAATAAWSLIVYASFVIRFQEVVTDRALLIERLSSIWAVPFARAQRSTEFQALENITLKLVVFALLGFLLTGWLSRAGTANRGTAYSVIALWVAFLAIAIEVSQAMLIPLVPDITDIIVYCSGAVLGILLYRTLMPVGKLSVDSCRLRAQMEQ